jgi:hypothetical protein
MAKVAKSVPSVDKELEQQALSYIAGEYTMMQLIWIYLITLNVDLACDLAVLLLGIY